MYTPQIHHHFAVSAPPFHHLRTTFSPQINLANAWKTHRNRRNHDRTCRNQSWNRRTPHTFRRFRTEFSPQRTSQPLFWMWILLFWVWFSSFLNVGKAIFNIVFACSSACMAVSADGKCWYNVLICCKMEVRTVECFVKFVKSWLETPETHHATAVFAPYFAIFTPHFHRK